jgi:hypothetical protein
MWLLNSSSVRSLSANQEVRATRTRLLAGTHKGCPYASFSARVPTKLFGPAEVTFTMR